MEEKTPVTPRKRKPLTLIDSYAVQCGKCYKWRFIESPDEYEDIRSEAPKKSFECKNCEEPGDVDIEGDSTRFWFLDRHGLPKTPHGFKRILVLRESCEKADVYYVTPQGKRLRSRKEVANFIQDNERFKDTKIEDVSFVAPKLMKKTKSKDVAVADNKTLQD